MSGGRKLVFDILHAILTTEITTRLLSHTKRYTSSETRQCVAIGALIVVFEQFGDFTVYLTGDEDTEEEICTFTNIENYSFHERFIGFIYVFSYHNIPINLVSEFLITLRKVCKDVLEDRLTVVSLQDPENFGKLDVALDEMFLQVTNT